MAEVRFTPNLRRHLETPELSVPGATVAEVLAALFDAYPPMRGYVLDDRGRLRQHVTLFVDGAMIRDRESLGDPVGPQSELYVMQALSGG